MAISGDYTIKREEFDGSLQMKDCYIKIKTLTVTAKSMAKVELGFFKQEPIVADVPIPEYMKDVHEVGVDAVFVPIDHEGEGYFKQAYKYIKQLPEYADCVDA